MCGVKQALTWSQICLGCLSQFTWSLSRRHKQIRDQAKALSPKPPSLESQLNFLNSSSLSPQTVLEQNIWGSCSVGRSHTASQRRIANQGSGYLCHLKAKRRTLGLNTTLCNWILYFLTGRPQVVRVGNNILHADPQHGGPSGVFSVPSCTPCSLMIAWPGTTPTPSSSLPMTQQW